MDRSDKTEPPVQQVEVPRELRDQVDELVRGAFGSLAQQLGRLDEDLKKHERSQELVRERIRSGARRTNGRIV